MMKDSNRFFIAGAAIALPCAITLAGNEPPAWAWVCGIIAVSIASIGGWLAAKEILAEEKQNNSRE
ncbi:hypothetical protein [Pseudomonas saliphila]|uniref:hypothetical protein n=1 Tax=Pseudomonas saliphila TaxID=2586906 RepID=UPI001239617E|nr:hypothetical protein [Pseudomonas saliphila]